MTFVGVTAGGGDERGADWGKDRAGVKKKRNGLQGEIKVERGGRENKRKRRGRRRGEENREVREDEKKNTGPEQG